LKSEIYELKGKVKSLEELIADFNKDDNKQKTKSSEAEKTKSKNVNTVPKTEYALKLLKKVGGWTMTEKIT